MLSKVVKRAAEAHAGPRQRCIAWYGRVSFALDALESGWFRRSWPLSRNDTLFVAQELALKERGRGTYEVLHVTT
jgi:hypothetical protein